MHDVLLAWQLQSVTPTINGEVVFNQATRHEVVRRKILYLKTLFAVLQLLYVERKERVAAKLMYTEGISKMIQLVFVGRM